MVLTGILTLIIIGATVLVSYKGFKSTDFMARYDFQIEKVTLYKDYKRLITAAFLHVNWWHLIFNMLALFFFSAELGRAVGPLGFAGIYFAGIAGGNLFALYIRKHNSGYSSIGASAGVSAVMFACVAIIPGMKIGLFFLPVPGWLLGIAYLLYSMYGIRSAQEGISHEAHLGGGVLGILIGLLLRPAALAANLWVVLLLLAPSLVFIFIVLRYPHLLITGSFTPRTNYSVDDRHNLEKKSEEEQVDEILEKINRKGIKSLTRKEREVLERYSRP